MTKFPPLKTEFDLNHLLKFIVAIKGDGANKELSLIDIISEYCLQYSLDVYMVGEAIADDKYFKSCVRKDCELHKIIPTKTKKSTDW